MVRPARTPPPRVCSELGCQALTAGPKHQRCPEHETIARERMAAGNRRRALTRGPGAGLNGRRVTPRRFPRAIGEPEDRICPIRAAFIDSLIAKYGKLYRSGQ